MSTTVDQCWPILTNVDQLVGQCCLASALEQLDFSFSWSPLPAGESILNLFLGQSNSNILMFWRKLLDLPRLFVSLLTVPSLLSWPIFASSWWRSKREGKKPNFGVKRSWEQRTFLNFKKQTPVDISWFILIYLDISWSILIYLDFSWYILILDISWFLIMVHALTGIDYCVSYVWKSTPWNISAMIRSLTPNSFISFINECRWQSRTRVHTIWRSLQVQRGQNLHQGKGLPCPLLQGRTMGLLSRGSSR